MYIATQGAERDFAPAYHEPLRPTPFYERQKVRNVVHDWGRWAGYLAPRTYIDLSEEYTAVRNNASVFDVTPMRKYRISGPDAMDYINRLVTRDMTRVGEDRVAYIVWCDDEGKIIEDGTVFRLGPQDYRLCCQEHMLYWLNAAAIGFTVQVRDETHEVAGLALQGPTSYTILSRMGFGSQLADLKPFQLTRVPFAGTELMISRTGFTGDLGYELWIDPAQALALWDALFEAGIPWGLKPIGTNALGLVRIEAGFLLAQLDFFCALTILKPSRRRSPFELGLDWTVNFNKGPFTGRAALLRENQEGLSRYTLVGIDVAGDKPPHLSVVYHRKKKNAGHVTSAMWSPVLKRNIGFAMLERPYGDTVTSDLWSETWLFAEGEWTKRWLELDVVDRKFFNPARRSATPPLPY